MGAVCLDSEQTDHYEEDDQHLLALAALALGTAWQARAADSSKTWTSVHDGYDHFRRVAAMSESKNGQQRSSKALMPAAARATDGS
jgi:hypothetical protein